MSKYSCYYIPKDKISVVNSLDNNKLSNAEDEEITIFAYGDKFQEEYNFETGNLSLYINNGDNTFSLLYEKNYYKDGKYSTAIFTNKGIYNIYYDEKDNPYTAVYMDGNGFNKLLKLPNLRTKNPLSKLGHILKEQWILASGVPIVLDGVPYNHEDSKQHLANLKTLGVKYEISSMYIPSVTILEEALQDINNYITTKEIDIVKMQITLMELQNFQRVCYDSTEIISEFVSNHDTADIQDLSNRLRKNISNIYKHIEMYLDEEIHFLESGEKDLC